VAVTVVCELGCQGAAHYLHEPVGVIVLERARAVAEQVAIVVPSIRHTAHTCQAVGRVVGVAGRALGGGHRQPVAHGVVGVLEVLAGGVLGGGQVVEEAEAVL